MAILDFFLGLVPQGVPAEAPLPPGESGRVYFPLFFGEKHLKKFTPQTFDPPKTVGPQASPPLAPKRVGGWVGLDPSPPGS